MNKSYALVWNQALGCWNVASEWARRRGKGGRSKAVVATGVSLLGLLCQAPAFALPNGATVVAGNASLHTSADGKHMNIDQQSGKLITNWNEFSVSGDERVSFHQPGQDSIALNRVIGTHGSDIQGRIDANGKVFLVNPNGVVFGKSAQVNVGGLVASSQNIADKDFLDGNYRFAGSSSAGVSNAGLLVTREGGSVALLGAQVSNSGVIRAQMGSVALGAGKDFSVNFDGNGLLNLQVNSGAVDALVHNGGVLKADGGQVLMTAKSANGLLKTVVSNLGVIEARTLQNKAGKIMLDGGDSGTVQVAGRQDASALNGQGNGGIVENRGAKVEVQLAAQVDTRANRGATGTWKIRSNEVVVADTDTLGKNPVGNNNIIGAGNIVNNVIGNSDNNTISLAGSGSVTNSQIGNGNGNGNNISASGAGNITNSQIGNGSGNNINLSGTGSIIGSQIGNNNGIGSNWSGGNIIGQQIGNINGNWMGSTQVAGRSVSIGGGINSSNGGNVSTGNSTPTLHADTLSKNLANTNIELVSNHGDMTLGAPVSWSSSNRLGLTAERGNIQVNGALNARGSNARVQLNAKQGSIQLNDHVVLSGAGASLELNAGKNGYALKDGKAVTLSGSGAAFRANGQAYDVVQNLDQLRKIENDMTGHYVLGNAIGGTGRFKSIGDGKTFTGVLDGLGNTISDLSIYGTSAYVGLFGANWGQISNLNLERISANGGSSTHYNTQVASLVGINLGSVRNVKAKDVNITGTSHLNTLGGLVSINLGGNIENSSVSGKVSGDRYTYALGGLVGENITSTNGVGRISNSQADTIVSGQMSSDSTNYGAGGLLGLNDGGRVTNSSSQGSINLTGDNLNIGGLVGHNRNNGSITNSNSSTRVSGGRNGVVGGLVGFNQQGSVANSSASGQVTGNATKAIGGLIGKNLNNALANVSASGNVSDMMSRDVGGLVGNNEGGAIANATTSNTVIGGNNANVGGLVGYSQKAAITNAITSGSAVGGQDARVGALVGNLASGRVDTSRTKGSVSGGQTSRVGGLVGMNAGQISTSSASVTVKGGYGATLGGLIGMNAGSVLLSSASGKIDFSPAYNQTYGGLIGVNFGRQYLNNVYGSALNVPMIGRNFGF
ncbi:filamentous hemagglutinin N-terminal domain-containing protein [Pseudomonas sp. CCM 7893]|uniref:Filamentous hemagglutinin N-terminal domain-containing protein n=1 Tax=Pseudomonas spelaei TaxID=1055469 RepID=A0A6I3W927_9PSED|nr:GLUG motif-containing protein [Pseudomonas spelaei]MUF03652.1 filamentous hemagglutinin N-terminal domain-containing protein [Pseudomonas spelaei]